MEEKLKGTIKRIVQLTQQNPEFGQELRKVLNIAPSAANVITVNDEKFNHIYEYCIEDVLKKQANEFYKDFPIKSIVPTLIMDYIRMETFRRKDNFGDFCLAAYQQIECITNKICESKEMCDIVRKMWGCAAYVVSNKYESRSIANRSNSEYSVADLIFGKKNSEEKEKKVLSNQFATDKIRIVLYFIGYKATLISNEYEQFTNLRDLLDDLYQCRNMNHRGSSRTPWQENKLDQVISMESLYYYKFLGALAQYVTFVKNGYEAIHVISDYAKSI
jgi:hypothetical protein